MITPEKIDIELSPAPLEESDAKVPEGLSARALGIYAWGIMHGPFTANMLSQVFAEGPTALRTALNELLDRKLARYVDYSQGGLRRTAFVLDAHEDGLNMIRELRDALARLAADAEAGVTCPQCGLAAHQGACPQ